MGLQVEVAGFLKGFAQQAKIDLWQGHRNVTIATGRPDSVYGRVIVAYKEPGTLSPNKEAARDRAVIGQLKRRFRGMRSEEGPLVSGLHSGLRLAHLHLRCLPGVD